jgi:hypothetical protein
VASSALASLDARLAELPKFGVGHTIHNLAVGAAVSAEIINATMNLGRMTGDTLQAAGVEVPLRDQSIAEMVEHRQEQDQGYVVEQAAGLRKKMSSGEGQEAKA